MRVSREAMAKNHATIVAAASRLLRRRGIDGLSVADLMQAVGLTHGGFYRHFESKAALVAEATEAAFAGLLASLQASAERDGTEAALRAYIDRYLSPEHIISPELGCPVAAYGVDAGRHEPAVRAAFARGIDLQIEWVAGCLPGPEQARRDRATGIVTTLVGAVVMARASGDATVQREILAGARRRIAEMNGTGP